ncbi:MAG: NTP transferase domain-containing protein [Geodermatophilaceae bacterium]|nr:NTP transferase domain-containing protein [Geodermatophilaceae bacterium]
MALTRILVVVLAGGAGSRLELLTDGRAKPAVPYGGMYRLIDFPLSNCLRAGIADVWVLMQYSPGVLADHLANGRPWDLDRSTGGFMVVHPHQGDKRGGWHQGTADALWRQSPLIREFDAEALVVVSADAVYKLDYLDVVTEHMRSGAAVTMVTTRVEKADAGRYGVVQVDDDGAITDYAYKPDEPASDLVTNEVFVFSPERVLDLLDDLAEEVDEDVGLEDLGNHVLPQLVDAGEAREFRFDGYWRDVGTVQAYWESHMDLLHAEPPIDLDEPGWRIQTQGGRSAAAAVHGSAEVGNSLLSPGCHIAGSVLDSVISPDVHVEKGATVRDSVLLHGVVVRAGAVVERSIIDHGVEIGSDARVGGDGEITLVGGKAQLAAGQTVPPGGRYPEPDDSADSDGDDSDDSDGDDSDGDDSG